MYTLPTQLRAFSAHQNVNGSKNADGRWSFCLPPHTLNTQSITDCTRAGSSCCCNTMTLFCTLCSCWVYWTFRAGYQWTLQVTAKCAHTYVYRTCHLSTFMKIPLRKVWFISVCELNEDAASEVTDVENELRWSVRTRTRGIWLKIKRVSLDRITNVYSDWVNLLLWALSWFHFVMNAVQIPCHRIHYICPRC